MSHLIKCRLNHKQVTSWNVPELPSAPSKKNPLNHNAPIRDSSHAPMQVLDTIRTRNRESHSWNHDWGSRSFRTALGVVAG
jgi:hypothetical protein